MKLQLKRSNVLESSAAKEPTAAQLDFGELAVNYNTGDPAIFLKDSSNNVIRISGVGNIADDGLTNVPSGTTPPITAEAGNLWYNTDEGRLYIYYVDTDTSQWVDASPDSYNPAVIPDLSNPDYQPGTLDDRYNSSEVQETPPDVNLKNEGALWWNSQDGEGQLYVLYDDPAPDGRKKWVEASPHPDVTGFIRSADGGTQQSITGGGGLDVDGSATFTGGSSGFVADLNRGGLEVQRTYGSATIGQIQVGRNDNWAYAVIPDINDTNTRSIQLNWDGSAEFADGQATIDNDQIQIGNTANKSVAIRRDTGAIRVSSDNETTAVFEGQYNLSTKAKIYANGSADFAGNIKEGWFGYIEPNGSVTVDMSKYGHYGSICSVTCTVNGNASAATHRVYSILVRYTDPAAIVQLGTDLNGSTSGVAYAVAAVNGGLQITNQTSNGLDYRVNFG